MMNNFLIMLSLCYALLGTAEAIDEKFYSEQYADQIVPLIKTMGEGFFVGEKNIKIHYRTYIQEGARNCLVILPGRAEPAEKYAEVVHDLSHTETGKNLNFYIMDHRGQGSSDRMKTPNDMGYVDQFKNYVTDLGTFVNLQGLESKCEKKFLLAHSLGAGIAINFILEHPNYFNKAAFSSPMLKIQTKPYSYALARTIVEASTLAGRGAKFAIGKKGFDPDLKFEDNKFTTSPARFQMTMALYETYPATKLGGVSNKWILEAMKATNKMRSRYHEITLPLRVFHAGIELYSESDEMVKLCDESINCKRLLFPTSKHEVLMDRDETRSTILSVLNEFYN